MTRLIAIRLVAGVIIAALMATMMGCPKPPPPPTPQKTVSDLLDIVSRLSADIARGMTIEQIMADLAINDEAQLLDLLSLIQNLAAQQMSAELKLKIAARQHDGGR